MGGAVIDAPQDKNKWKARVQAANHGAHHDYPRERRSHKLFHGTMFETRPNLRRQQHPTTARPRRPLQTTFRHSLREVGATVVPGNHGGGPDESSILPRQYTEEEKISLAVTQLAQNEKLLGALAWRLGIPLENVRPDGREPPLARERGTESGGGGGAVEGGVGDQDDDEEELDENRGKIEVP